MPSMSSKDFFATWKHSLSADFQQDNVPAESSNWVTETAKIPTNGDPKVIALSDDNSLLAAGIGHQVYVYDVPTLKLIRTLQGHVGYTISRLEFQPGGRKIAASSERRSGKLESFLRILDFDEPVQHAQYLDEAAKAAVSAASAVLLHHWSEADLQNIDLQTGIAEILATGHVAVEERNGRLFRGNFPSFDSCPFSHDGRTLLFRPDRNDIVVLDVDTLKQRLHLTGHTDGIMWAETSPDDTIIGTSSWDRTVRLWSIGSGEPIRVLEGATGQSWGGAFSPDGALIAAGSGDQHVRIWRVETGELLHTLSGFTQWIRSLSFSPDNAHIAAGAAGGTLRIFDVHSGECEQNWQVDTSTSQFVRSFVEISGVQYTCRGDLFFTSSGGRVFGYRAADNVKWECGETAQYVKFRVSRDGTMFLGALRDGAGVGIWKID
ncbi:Wd-40 repeat protein [Favolaschia claudopus]|uniref:Wd-40 repeat protein n=1 Tax=Favolaschia claudopus TaxID=2862362 RepID=A0AAW0BMN1_9AGAR